MSALPSVLVAVALVLAALGGTVPLATVAGLLGVLVAAGWPRAVDVPAPVAASVLIGLTGLSAVAATAGAVAAGWSQPLGTLAPVTALGVLAAFGRELVRRDGRPRLVESLTATVAGQVTVVLVCGWVLLPATDLGAGGVLVAGSAVAAARAATALPWPVRLTSWAAFALGATVAALSSWWVEGVRAPEGALTGIVVAAGVAGLDRLLVNQPGARRGAGLIAAATAPVAVAGAAAYLVALLLGL